MGNPIVHFEIRSSDPTAGRRFYSQLFGWTFADAPPDHVSDYAYIDTKTDRTTIHGGISPLQGQDPMVAVYAEVDDIDKTLAKAIGLGATVVQEPYHVPGVTIALISDPQGTVIGVAQPRRTTDD